MSLLAFRRLLLLLLCLSLAPCAHARRGFQALDVNIRQSDLIVIADTRPGEKPTVRPLRFSTLLSIDTVLKGDQKWAGQTLDLPRTLSFENPLPNEAKNIAVLLKRYQSPAGEETWGVQETYASPAEIAAITALIPIYALPSERAQLLALRTLWTSENPVLRAQWIADLGTMHETENFDLLLDFFPRADVESQKRLIEIMGRIGDQRALPLLIAMLENEKADEKLRYSSAWQLNFYFHGAPGVTNAFRHVFATAKGNLQVLAARYLNEREPDAKYQAGLPAPTAWQRAEKKRESGDLGGARALWWQVLATPDTDDFARRWAAVRILPIASAEKARFRDATLSLVQRDSQVDNYLWRRDDAQILRAMAQPADVDLLLSLSDKSGNDDVTRREVALALHELGGAAQEKAAARWLQNLTKNSAGQAANIPHPDLLALAWLGSDDDWQRAQTILGANWSRGGKFLDALKTAAHAKDEGAALNDLLERTLAEPGDLQPTTLGWLVFRLGDLADARAVPALTKFLLKYGTYDNYSVTQALTRIGQKDATSEAIVVAAMTSVLAQPDKDRIGGQAVQIIADLQRERARPLLRSIVSGDDSGPKMEAMSALSRVGTPEDLPVLLPLADFWTAPRGLQYWAVDAVTHLRQRFGLDVGAALQA